MSLPIEKPKITVAGLSLGFYNKILEGYMAKLENQLAEFLEKIKPFADIIGTRLCFEDEHFTEAVMRAEKLNVDAILLVPMSYTASMMVLATLRQTNLPVVVWNTQMAMEITADYDFDTLLLNHVPQGVQDITNMLVKNQRIFGIESGYFADQTALARLKEWLEAAMAVNYCRRMKVGILGRPFPGMGDFEVSPERLKTDWGPEIVALDINRFAELVLRVNQEIVDEKMADCKKAFEVSPDLDEEVIRISLSYELALESLVYGSGVHAFTMNFLDLIDSGFLKTLPFFGINRLMLAGIGYAGEGDVMTAAHMAQMRKLCGVSNFTEIYTVDYKRNHLLMTHMQECNPALARKDRKIKLVRRDFWAPGIEPYAGMHFTLEPGPVTITSVSFDATGNFYYVVYEGEIVDMEPLEKFVIPHWLLGLNEPAGNFLTRYSEAGGGHHLAAVPGHRSEVIKKLSRLQGFGCKDISV